MKKTYITNFRLAATLVANGYPLLGVTKSRSFSSRQYFFPDSKELKIMTFDIGEQEDNVSSYNLYQANDFLAHEIRKNQYRDELLVEFSDDKEV